MTDTALVDTGIAGPDQTPPGARRPARRWWRGRGVVLGGLVAAAVAAGAGTAIVLVAGETFTVNTTADATDVNPGDGECATAGGLCSLRAAVQESNALDGAQSVGVPAGTYELAIAPLNENLADTGDLDVTGDLTIAGAGAGTILDAGNPPAGAPPGERGMDRLIEIHDVAKNVTLRGLTIREGYTDEAGGGIQFGTPPPAPIPGQPVPVGTLTLDHVTVKDSFASKAGGGVNNAGRGRVVVTASTLSGNATGGTGAAINNATTGTVEITGSQVVDNPGRYIPDPQHDPTSIDPPELVPAPGVYTAGGGAIANQAETNTAGTIRITGSTVARNTAGAGGAGVHNGGDGTVTVANTTLADNRSLGSGGGLYTSSGAVTITATAITGNIAADGGGFYSSGELTQAGLRPRFDVTGGTISGNTAEGGGGGLHSGGDGQLTLSGVTVSDNAAVAVGGGISSGESAELTMTGGAITGNSSHDFGGGLAAGSERNTTITDVEISGNAAEGEPDPVFPGVPTDSAGGGGAHTDGGGTVTITNTRFLNNTATGDGGGLAMHGLGSATVVDSLVKGNTVTCEECSGGGIEQGGADATLQRVLVEDNSATANGGGVHNASSGEFTVLDTTIQRNVAEAGGGFANQSDSTLVMRGSLILDNRAKNGPREDHGKGGGIVSISDGGGVIENTTISGNTATVGGGGMFHDADAGMLLIHVTIWNNSAPSGVGIGVVESDFVPSVPPQANPGLIARNSIIGGGCDAQITTQGGNVDTGNLCFVELNTDSSAVPAFKDRRNARVQLDAIADNGGPTMTHALPADSLAIDGGVAAIANADGTSQGVCPATDQRGVTRPHNAACDTGAYEFEGPPILDAVPPDTEYLDGPVQNSFETQIFTFTGSDEGTAVADLQYECRLTELDPTEPIEPLEPGRPVPPELAFGGCTSPWSVPLTEEGDFVFEVRAIDRGGNVDPTPAVHRFDGLDLEPPVTSIVEYPPNPSTGRAATFGFTATDNMTPAQFMEYECRIDSRDPEAWIECVNPVSYGDLTTGRHTFEVRAFDGAENIGPAARYTWDVGIGDPANCDDANITLRPTGDAWVDETDPGVNSSFEEFLTVRSSDQPGEAARSLLQFRLPTDAPECALQGAVLRLHGEGDPGRTLAAQPLDRQWLPHTVTWASQPGVTGTAVTAPSPAGEGWVEFTVTADVLRMLAGELPNNGFRISDALEVDAAGGGDASFASSEAPFAPPEDPDPAPQLVLLYEPGSAPPPPPPAEPPPGELTTVTCGMFVNTSIRLANDLHCPLGEGLVVAAPNIVLDLNGHVIDGPNYLIENTTGQEEGFPAAIRNGGHDNVVIRGGTVQEFGFGVQLTAGTIRNEVHDLVILRNAVAGVELFDADDGRNGNTIRNSRIADNELGVHVFTGSDNSRILDNEITGNLGEAVLLANSAGTLVQGNTIHGIPTDPVVDSDGGFLLESASNSRIIGNTIRDTGDAGLVLTAGSNGNRIEGNTMYRNGDAGVSVQDSARNEIVGNTAHQESDGGVVLNNAPDTLVQGNDLRFNPSGVDAAGVDRLRLIDNDGSDSLQAGFGVASGAGVQIVGNTAHRTGGSGIALEAAATDANGNPIDGGLVERNRADENAAEGISVVAGGHRVAGNEAYHNAGLGISAEGNLDGGGNLALGNNGGLGDCLGVLCGPGTAPPLSTPDTTAPETLIDTAPAHPSNSTSATFAFSSTDAGTPNTAMVFECRLDPGPDPVAPLEPPDPPDVPDPNNPLPPEPPDTDTPPDGLGWEECLSPVTYHQLEPGPHRFEVRALDQADLRDATPAVHEWTAELVPGSTGPDTVAPNTTIRGFPAPQTTATDARFVFSGSDNATVGPDLRYECSLDGAPFTACTSPQLHADLDLGLHRFEVRAIDLTGNVDAGPAFHEWTVGEGPVDETAPDATIVAGPDRTTVASDATFVFAANEEGSRFDCELDTVPAGDCTSPHVFTGLAPGEHTVRVWAIDAAGNRDLTPAVYTWRVGDAAVPAEVFCGEVVTRSIVVDNDLLDCLSDGLVVGASGITIDLNGHTLDGSGLGAGVAVNGFDDVTVTNGTLAEFDAGVDLPAGTLRAIVDRVTAQQNQVAGVLLTDADEAIVRASTFTGNDVGVQVQKGTTGAVVRANTFGANSEAGVHLERADGNRVEGNQVLGGIAGVTVGGARNNTVTGNTLQGNGTGVSVGRNELTQLLVVQRPPEPNVPEPPPPSPETVGLPSADNTVSANTITEANGAGVLVEGSQAGATVRTTVLDNVVHGGNGAGVELDWADDNVIRGNDLSANKAGVDLASSNRNVIESNDASSGDTGIALQALSLGNDIVLNTANDNTGNGIYVGDPAAAGSGNVVDRNTANNNGSSGIAITDIAHVVSGNTANDNGNWGIDAKPGTIDRGGNRAIGNVALPQCFNIRCEGTPPADIIPPETLVLSGPPAQGTATTAVFRFTGTDNAGTVTFECSADGAPFAACTSPHTVANLTGGAHAFAVRAVDEAGNRDTTPAAWGYGVAEPPPGLDPDTTIVSGPDATTSATSATFTFTSSEPADRFECALDTSGFEACDSLSQHTLSDLPVGDHTLAVRAVDTEDRTDPSPATFTWTVAAAPAPTEVGCGEVLTQSVLVTNDLIDCEGIGLVIGADGITVDLGGHAIDGTGLGAGILNPRHDRVAVTNGTVREFDHGVEFDPTAERGTVSALALTDNAVAGVLLADADGATVRNSEFTGNAVGVLAGPGTRGAVLRDNLFTASAAEAIRFEVAGGSRIEGNTITGSGGFGIALSRSPDNAVLGNTLSDNPGGAISVGEAELPSDRNRVEANTITGGSSTGIGVTDSAGTVVADNDVSGAAGSGVALELARDTQVLGNALRGNGTGVSVDESAGVLIRGNDASGALGAGIALEALVLDADVIGNAANGNGGEGIAVEDLAPAGRGALIEGNVANDNLGDGIHVGQAGHVVAANRAINNGGWGVFVELGTTDGGGNVAAGNIEPAQCFQITCEITDSPGAPDTELRTFPANPSDSRYAAFTFVGSDDTSALIDITYQCRLDSIAEEDFVDCEYPQEYFTLAPGSHRFEVRAVDLEQRVDPTPATYEWTYLAPPAGVAPDTVLLDTPPAESPLLEGLLTFSSTEADAAFECRIDPLPDQPETGWEVCSAPEVTPALGYGFYEYAFEDIQVGRHAFEVRAVDVEGLVDPTPARHEWTVTGGPVTTILTGPADLPPEPLEPLAGGETTSPDATFVFDSANEPNSTFACSLDFQEFVDCNTPAGGSQPPTVRSVTYTGLLPGEHIFRVVATDPLGREEIEPPEYEWEVLPPLVSAPPTASITVAPASGTSDLTFAFTGTDDITPPTRLIFECRVDSTLETDFSECVSPFNLLERYTYLDPQLAPGEHTFEVRALDETEPTPMIGAPVSHTWTSVADTVAPQTAITARPPARTGEPTATFEFVGSDNATLSTEPSPLLEFECALNGAAFAPCDSPASVEGVPGENTFAVRAVDLAGNTGPAAQHTWTIAGAPVTTIDPVDPIQLDSSVTITFTADQAGSTYECETPTSGFAPCTSPLTVSGLAGGENAVSVRATNPELVTEDPPATVAFTVSDSTAPDTTIVGGPIGNGTLHPSGTATFSFAAGEPGSTFECAVDGGTFGSCASPTELTALTDGQHSFAVRAIDPSGNVDASAATRSFTVNLPPVTTILTAPEELTADTTVTFTLEANEPVTGFECLVNTNGVANAPAPCTSPFTYTAPGTGGYLFAVRATDTQGNTNPLYTVEEWTVGLGVTFTETPPATTDSTTALFAFAPNDPSPLVRMQCSLDGAEFTLCTSPVEFTDLTAGMHSFAVQSARPGMPNDPVPVTSVWTITDDVPPVTTIASGPAQPSSDSTTATFVFGANEPNVTFQCALDAAAFADCASPVVLDGLGLGAHTFRVQAIDSAENVEASPATYAWTVTADDTPPNSTVTLVQVIDGTDAQFGLGGSDTGTPTAELTFQCRLDNGPVEPCDNPHEVADLTRGEHTIAVAAIDRAGNIDASPATRTFRIDGEINTFPGTNVIAEATTPVGVVPEVSAELTFATVSRQGATYIEPLAGAPEVTGAFEAGAVTYDIGTTAVYQGPVTVCVDFDPAQYADPNRVRLLHHSSGAWADVTGPPSELTNGIVCGRVTSLSPFAIAVTTGPVADQAPETTITRGPGATTVNAVAVFEFTGTDDLTDPLELEFECSVDGGPFASCDLPHTTEALPAGEHRMEIRAVDLSGNADPTPAVRTWTVVDLTPLDTAIETGPESPTFDTTATFTFLAEPEVPGDEVGATFRCALNEGDFAPCTSPHTVEGLTTAGAQVFLVSAVDAAGNADPTPDVYEWLIEAPVDTSTPPDTFILGGPPPVVAPAETETEFPPSLTFTSDQAGVEFECRENGGAWESCESPVEYGNQPVGSYTVEVRAVRVVETATGDVTLVDETPAAHSWSVSAAPDTRIDAGPASPAPGSTATFTFSSEAGATFTCAVDGGEPLPCTSPWVERDLIEGPHTFEVVATNSLRAVDPTPATYSWIQGLPPETTITSATDVPDPVEPEVVVLQVRFTGTDDRTPQLEISYECRLNHDGAEGTWSGCELQEDITYADLAPGEYVFQVRAVDLGESADPTPAEHRFTVAAAPDTAILAGAPGTPAAETESTTATFTFSTGQSGATFECSLDRAPEPVWEPCTSPATYADLAQGEHEFLVRARGATGVVDPDPAAFGWVIGDLTPPTLTLVSGPAATTGETSATFVFEADEAGLTFTCTLDGVQPGRFCTSPYTLENLSADAHVLEITASRPHLLVEPEPLVVEWTIGDAAPPDTAITSAPTAPVAETATATVAFTGTDNGTPAEQLVFECSLDGAPFAGCSSPQEFAGLAVGEHSLAVRAVDLTGLADPEPAAATWTVVDTTAPETTISGAPESGTTERTAVFTFESTEPGTFTCALDGALVDPCVSPLELTGLGEGAHRFSVTARDAAGNPDVSAAVHEWTIGDITAPNAVLTSGPPATGSTSSTALFAFAANEPDVTFTCTLDGGAPVSCTSPTEVTGLVPGAHEMRIVAIDAAGNADPSPVVHAWTLGTPPQAAPTCPAPGTRTLTASGDTWIMQSDPAKNNGPDSVLKVTSKSNGNNRALVRFDLPPLPAGCTVLDATLRMHLSSPKTGRTLDAYRASVAWTETGATWNNARNTVGTAVGVASGSTPGYRDWAVAEQVRAMYAGTNTGFLIRDRADNASTSPEQAFDSREATNRPQLVLTFGGTPDTTAPDTVLDAAPPAESTGTDALFAFSATEAGSSFACSVDGATFTPCTSPTSVVGLTPGSHTFAVRATDQAQNTDPSPATVAWTIVGETPPPNEPVAAAVAEPQPTTTTEPPPPTTTTTEPPPTTTTTEPPPTTTTTEPAPTTTTTEPPPTTTSTTTSAAPSCTGGTVTVVASRDSWVQENDPGKNYGADSVLKVTTKAGLNTRALVGFDLPAAPAGCRVTGAELRVHDGSAKPGHTIEAHALAATWTENGVTWANQPATTGTAATAATPSGSGTMTWNVTAQVQAGAVHGFLLKDAAENGNGDEQGLHSREKAPDAPPVLVVTFGPA